MGIINLGEGFCISQCREVVDYMLDCYGVCAFSWVKGIRNEVLINRLLKKYKIINVEENEIMKKVEFKKGE